MFKELQEIKMFKELQEIKMFQELQEIKNDLGMPVNKKKIRNDGNSRSVVRS